MKPEHYIHLFKNIGSVVPIWNSVFLIMNELHDKNKDALVQEAINKLGHNIVEDGVIGNDTITILSKCDPTAFLTVLGELLTSEEDSHVDEHSTLKNIIMPYLAKAEGLHLHWNARSETDFTTPYGVYAHSFPNSKPVKYIRRLAFQKGFKRVTRKNVHKIDSSLTPEERRKLADLIYEFYIDNFMDPKVNEHLGPKSALTFFSNSVNGGRSRGYKSLQSALKVTVDGKFGKESLRALTSYKGTDTQLNAGMLAYMRIFYHKLAEKPKFKIYLSGWLNRLKNLA